jgi:hypothetical protein
VSTLLKCKAEAISNNYKFNFNHTTRDTKLAPSETERNLSGSELIAEGLLKKRKTELEAKFEHRNQL